MFAVVKISCIFVSAIKQNTFKNKQNDKLKHNNKRRICKRVNTF